METNRALTTDELRALVIELGLTIPDPFDDDALFNLAITEIRKPPFPTPPTNQNE